MPQANHYDVIIIGAGAGGDTLALALASSGKRFLLIEHGEYVPREKSKPSITPKRFGATTPVRRCIRTRTTMSAATPSFMDAA
jgi:choline dehydrogenase-like flavoprotein